MFFTVIIPIYNSAKSLSRCLESVRKQVFTDFEVIMVNDGSIDNSEEICKYYELLDSRFHYIYQKNGGVSIARNCGIEKAKGTYITFLDSDDIYYKDYLKSFNKMIRSYPQAGHYWCAFQEFDSENAIRHVHTVESDNQLIFFDRKDIMTLHHLTLDASPWNKVYKREILHNLKMKPELSLGEDMIFNFEYLDQNPNTTILLNTIPQYGYYCGSSESLDHKFRVDLELIYKEILSVIKWYLEKWTISYDQWKLYYNTVVYMYENMMRNYFRTENNQLLVEKYNNCNRLLSEKDFCEALKLSNCGINPMLRFAYKMKRYEIVRFLDCIIKLKQWVLRRNLWKKRKVS